MDEFSQSSPKQKRLDAMGRAWLGILFIILVVYILVILVPSYTSEFYRYTAREIESRSFRPVFYSYPWMSDFAAFMILLTLIVVPPIIAVHIVILSVQLTRYRPTRVIRDLRIIHLCLNVGSVIAVGLTWPLARGLVIWLAD